MNALELLEPLINPDESYEMTDWQEKDLRYLSPMPYSANWSQMGCYKTSTGLWLLEKRKARNALIVTSKGGKGSYFSDFYKCLPESWHLYNCDVHETTQMIEDYEAPITPNDLFYTIKTGRHNYPIVAMAHYDVFTNTANLSSAKRAKDDVGMMSRLQSITWDEIIVDEAHRLKNPKTQWTRNLKRFQAKNKHIMTGTAFINNPAEIWSLLNFLHRSEWSNYWAFRNYFCDQFVDARGFRHIRGLLPYRVEEFRALRKRLGPRHLMHTVHKNIPKPIETTHTVDLNAIQKKMYLEIKTTLQTMDQKGALLSSPNVLSQLNRLRQVSAATPEVISHTWDQTAQRMVYEIKLVDPSKKLDKVMEILGELDDPEQKVVIFSNFKDPLFLLEKRLEKEDIQYLHMQQKHSDMDRYRMWHDQFRLPDNKVFMSTLALGGESINLSCAQYLIFIDRSWSPKDMMQAVGRVYRPGQEHGCEVIHIVAKGTVDKYVHSKLTTKENWFNEIFGD